MFLNTVLLCFFIGVLEGPREGVQSKGSSGQGINIHIVDRTLASNLSNLIPPTRKVGKRLSTVECGTKSL